MTALDSRPVAGRRVTPAGRLVLPATAPKPAWLAARRLGTCSSDLPALFGIYDYERGGTSSHVYHEKIGELPPDPTADQDAFWSRTHAASVARVWAQRNGTTIRRVGLISQGEAPWRMCTLDRRVGQCPLGGEQHTACALKVKVRSAYTSERWQRRIPDDVLIQMLWQALVTGYDHIHGAVLIGGSDYRQFTVFTREHQQLIGEITAEADRFWHENVVARRPPDPAGNPAALAGLYDALHPVRHGVAVLGAHAAVRAALQEYMEAGLEESAAEERKKRARATMIGALGDADTAVVGEHAAYTYRPVERVYIDPDRLAERWPEAYDDCAAPSSPRRLEIGHAFRQSWKAKRLSAAEGPEGVT
jgi:predicted phage-related endonuclease